MSDTPSTWHLLKVALFATQIQSLVIVLLFQTSLNLKGESLQVDVVGAALSVTTGAAVGVAAGDRVLSAHAE